MQHSLHTNTVRDEFIAPISELLPQCKNRRECRHLSDQVWLEMGVERVLGQQRSGRGFLQDWAMTEASAVRVSSFFESLKSKRRQSLVKELNTALAVSMPTHRHSVIDTIQELNGIDIYAGDGHYHRASTHEQPIKGKRRAVGHFYTLNYRTHAMTHLTAADLQDGRKKREHDMHALKRLSASQLRQGAKTGHQVLYVWDRAGIDIPQWQKWKQSSGVYFLTRTKELMKIMLMGALDFDRDDPLNAGVLDDQIAGSQTGGYMFRHITYQCPVTGEIFEFITNHMKIRPGILAWLYLRRWDIEKTYDTFKNKLDETQAWASSDAAKSIQAQFLCLTHNLIVLLEALIEVEDPKETERCRKRNLEAQAVCEKHGRGYSTLLFSNHSRRTQIGLKFIRWLRHQLKYNNLISEAKAALVGIYALF